MNKILVVVDVQNDFIDGSLGTKEAQEIVDKVADRIREYNTNGDLVLFTKDTHEENYLDTQEGKNLPVKHCIKDTPGWGINDTVRHAWKEYRDRLLVFNSKNNTFYKNSFGSVELANYISCLCSDNNFNYDIELCGLCTGICVLSNAVMLKSYLPENKISVNAGCCACVTPESHKTAIEAMKMCQINIIE